MRFQPGRRRLNLGADRLGRSGMGQLVPNSGWNDDLLEQNRKNLDLSDEDEVTDGACVGDYDAHRNYNPRLRTS